VWDYKRDIPIRFIVGRVTEADIEIFNERGMHDRKMPSAMKTKRKHLEFSFPLQR